MSTLLKATFAFGLLLAAPTINSETTRVTLSFKEFSLSQATNELGMQAGLTFGFPPQLGWRLGPDITLKNVPADIAVEVLAAAYQVCFERSTQVIHLHQCDSKSGRVEYR